MNTLISALVSFLIAGYGWNLLNKRADKTAKRSETFSLISIIISLLNDFEIMAEEQFKGQYNEMSLVGPIHLSKLKRNSREQQINEAKFLARYNLFTARLVHLESRNIKIPESHLIELKKAMTLDAVNSPIAYQKVLRATQKIHQELYIAFDREYS